MRSVFISAVALMAILLPSCNKEISPIPTTDLHKKLIKSAFSGYYRDTTIYQYDPLGRLLKIDGHEDDFTFTYVGDSVTVIDSVREKTA